MAKTNPLFKILKQWVSLTAESPDQDIAVESPYTKYLADRSKDNESPLLTPITRDVFLLDSELRHGVDTVGLFHGVRNILMVRDPHKKETGRFMRWKVEAGSLAFFGNWLGYGRDMLGFYHPEKSVFSLWYGTDHQQADIRFSYGLPKRQWIPLIGDWDGDGKDGIGLYDPATGYFFLRNSLSAGLPDYYFRLDSKPGHQLPLAGDWNGDGVSGVGLYDPEQGLFRLTNRLDSGRAEMVIHIEKPEENCIPLAGDWNGTGADKFGLYQPQQSRFYQWWQLDTPASELSFRFSPKGLRGHPFSLRWSD